MPRINKKKFRLALDGSWGVYVKIAKRLGVTRQSVSIFVKKNPDLYKEVQEEKERMIDIAESSLHAQILAKNFPATKYFLSTQAKHRNYIEKTEQELTHKGDTGNVTINIIDPRKKKSPKETGEKKDKQA